MFASKSTRGFYNPYIHASMPPDAIELPNELHTELLAGLAAGKLIDWESQVLPVLIDPPPVELSAEQLCAAIDKEADAAREMVAGNPLRAVEYQTAALEAHAFKDAGYPQNAVPRGVAAWAIGGRTIQQAADNIVAEANAYTEVLYRLREIRLLAKERIRRCIVEGEISTAQQLHDEALLEIQKIIVGIGNAES